MSFGVELWCDYPIEMHVAGGAKFGEVVGHINKRLGLRISARRFKIKLSGGGKFSQILAGRDLKLQTDHVKQLTSLGDIRWSILEFLGGRQMEQPPALNFLAADF